MTWAGESSVTSSGLYIFTSDGSPNELLGASGEILIWSDMPLFVSQASLTGVAPLFLNQVGDVSSSVPASGQALAWDGAQWTPSEVGNIDGPGISTDNAVARFDGTSGKLIQNSNVIVDDSGNITLPGGQIVNGRISSLTSLTLATEDYLLISTATANRTVFLPASPSSWQAHNIKDGAGNAKTKLLTIDGNGNTIDGCDKVTINGPYSCFTVVYNGTEWSII